MAMASGVAKFANVGDMISVTLCHALLTAVFQLVKFNVTTPATATAKVTTVLALVTLGGERQLGS
jgi:hypothetical protein